ncbi:hypothetical protein [Sporosarcina sp. JAI121]|uniref:hypothetical protein n=1 Tax=Sporosarcina sp. JAI121 TaxID=2723064 RepID=UPI00185F018E|nr:hypothetical protein [Sporosarcina sp. JAI121]NYF24537.1 hypothetical protein [Sporosarcina sp. JAI121]
MRDMVHMIALNKRAVSELAEPFGMSLAAFSWEILSNRFNLFENELWKAIEKEY